MRIAHPNLAISDIDATEAFFKKTADSVASFKKPVRFEPIKVFPEEVAKALRETLGPEFDKLSLMNEMYRRELTDHRSYVITESENDTFTIRMDRWGQIDEGLWDFGADFDWKSPKGTFKGTVIEKRLTEQYVFYVVGDIVNVNKDGCYAPAW